MATKPSLNKPNWNPPTEATIEPSGSKKLTGHVYQEPLPAKAWNWLLKSISAWITYFEEVTDEIVGQKGVAAQHIVTDKNVYITPEMDGVILLLDPTKGNSLPTEMTQPYYDIFSGDPDAFPPGSDIAFNSTNMYGQWVVLPDQGEVPAGFKFTIKDTTGLCSEMLPITLVGGKIDFMTWQQVPVGGTGGMYETQFGPQRLAAPYGQWTLVYDGLEWQFI